jgi:hypothetical protein
MRLQSDLPLNFRADGNALGWTDSKRCHGMLSFG